MSTPLKRERSNTVESSPLPLLVKQPDTPSARETAPVSLSKLVKQESQTSSPAKRRAVARSSMTEPQPLSSSSPHLYHRDMPVPTRETQLVDRFSGRCTAAERSSALFNNPTASLPREWGRSSRPILPANPRKRTVISSSIPMHPHTPPNPKISQPSSPYASPYTTKSAPQSTMQRGRGTTPTMSSTQSPNHSLDSVSSALAKLSSHPTVAEVLLQTDHRMTALILAARREGYYVGFSAAQNPAAATGHTGKGSLNNWERHQFEQCKLWLKDMTYATKQNERVAVVIMAVRTCGWLNESEG